MEGHRYSPEASAEIGPTKEQLMLACAEILKPEDIEFLADCEFDEALGYVYGRLIEEGYDPDEFLAEHSILERQS